MFYINRRQIKRFKKEITDFHGYGLIASASQYRSAFVGANITYIGEAFAWTFGNRLFIPTWSYLSLFLLNVLSRSQETSDEIRNNLLAIYQKLGKTFDVSEAGKYAAYTRSEYDDADSRFSFSSSNSPTLQVSQHF